MDPTISVVCPTYNSARFVIRTLESVFQQTRLPDQVVISDDGSTDDTIKAVHDLCGNYPSVESLIVPNLHGGAGAARNSGIKRAGCDWIAFIDSDDVWLPRKLQAVVEGIRDRPDANLICHAEEQIRLDGSTHLIDYGAWYDTGQPVPRQLYYRNFLSTSALTCRKQLLLDAGLFNEKIRSGVEDYDLWLRMSPAIKPYFIREKLGYYFDRAGNLTSNNELLKWRDMIRLALSHRHYVHLAGAVYQMSRLTAFYGLRGIRRVLP